MRPFLLLVAIAIGFAALIARADARIQPPIVCFDPDMEFPVACDEDDD